MLEMPYHYYNVMSHMTYDKYFIYRGYINGHKKEALM